MILLLEIIILILKYGTKYTKTHDIFLIHFMTDYWEIDAIINNIDEPFVTLSSGIL